MIFIIGSFQGLFSTLGGLWIHLCDYQETHLSAQFLCGSGHQQGAP